MVRFRPWAKFKSNTHIFCELKFTIELFLQRAKETKLDALNNERHLVRRQRSQPLHPLCKMMMKNGANLAHLLANNHNKPLNLTTVITP
jgi:hypothetical protein